jgi:ribosomal protein S18 acetylase RimI-like enzyme
VNSPDHPEASTSARPRIEPLDSHHDRAAFSCGTPALDRYLHQQARQDVTKRVAAAFVLTEPPSPAVLGFYTLTAASVQLQDLPPTVVKRLPKYPHVPATLLGRLAVDHRARGRRYGELLLLDALVRSLDASRTVASAAVIVDAKDDAARRFYERYHFLSLPETPARLFLPTHVIETLFRDQK